MDSPHPLDRPIWSALTTRQAAFAVGGSRALRFEPDIALFAAAADRSPEAQAALAALAPAEGHVGLVEVGVPPTPPGLVQVSTALCDQRIVENGITARPTDLAIEPLGDADSAAMLALATLTKPGPFFARTHELGRFVGLRIAGSLVAMAGERLQPTGFTEVSGVCTHPDHRGKGYAAALMAHVAQAILARGETPFLHAYSDNNGANALYERIGFSLRRRMTFTVFSRL